MRGGTRPHPPRRMGASANGMEPPVDRPEFLKRADSFLMPSV